MGSFSSAFAKALPPSKGSNCFFMPYSDIFKHGHWKYVAHGTEVRQLGGRREFTNFLGMPLTVEEDNTMREILHRIPVPAYKMADVALLIQPLSSDNRINQLSPHTIRFVVRLLSNVDYEILTFNSEALQKMADAIEWSTLRHDHLSSVVLSIPPTRRGASANTEPESFQALGFILRKPHDEFRLLLKTIQNDLRIAIPALSASCGTFWIIEWFDELLCCSCCCEGSGGLLGYRPCACLNCGCCESQPFLLFKVLDGTNQRTDGKLRITVLRNESSGAEENSNYVGPLETPYFEAVAGHDAQYLVHSRVFYRVESHQCSSCEAHKVRLIFIAYTQLRDFLLSTQTAPLGPL